jgi:hypothetical protein
LAAVILLAPAMADDQDAKGIFLDKTAPGVKFAVTLRRGADRLTVPTSFEFRSGDRMVFHFSLNRDAYVYVLTRSIPGDSAVTSPFAGSKGIEIIESDGSKIARPATAYRLLFPLLKTGLQNKLSADVTHTVPSNGAQFTMDSEPGIEKIYLVLSPKAIDMKQYFDMETGKMLQDGAQDARSDRGLGAELLGWSKNAQTSIADPASKGIQIEGYGVSSDSNRTALVEIDLKHSQPAAPGSMPKLPK